MISRLRKRLLCTLTAILTLFFWLILLLVNIQNYRFNLNQGYNILRQFDSPRKMTDTLNRGEEKKKEKEIDETEQFHVYTIFYENGTVYLDERMEFEVDNQEEVLNIAEKILKTEKDRGRYHSFLYLAKSFSEKTILYFMNFSSALERVRNMILFSLLLGILGSFLLFWFSYFLTKWMIHPVEEAFTRQKQFISDASHELKTPLTVIGANAELLKDEIGPNKWLSYIQSETKRMSKLVNDLLSLTRLEDSSRHPVYSSFSLSRAVTSILLPFESVAFEHDIQLKMDLAEEISFYGNEDQIKQVISILTDNAICHTNSEGTIQVSLKQTSKKILITVANTGEPIPPKMQTKIFDRFYRGDEARFRVGGHYGLGLSIAQAIVTNHNGSIQVHCADGWTTFTLSFPLQSS